MLVPEVRAYQLWLGAKRRAAAKGLEFSISRRRIERALRRQTCEVTRLQFDLRAQRMGALTPSIDRIDPALGYTDDNINVVCWIYNRAKGNGSHQAVMLLVEALAHAVGISQAA